MNWLEITIDTKKGSVDEICLLLESMGFNELVVEDGADFEKFLEESHQYWDYVDEALRKEKRDKSLVKLYVSDDEKGRESISEISNTLNASGFDIKVVTVKDEDWENNWQQYYHPIEVGEKLIIVPEWDVVPEMEGRAVLRLNPGLIFGTGSHPTTRMCLIEIEKAASPEINMLDLGCGSGILSIAALVLGCKSALGCDIDEKAPDTAIKNAELSGVNKDNFKVFFGDALSDGALRETIGKMKYELICANIVADVIIRLAPDIPSWLSPDGIFVCSGIIEGRQDEVKNAIKQSGLRIIETRREEDWYCLISCLPCLE